ncbi:MAG: hypothetical protein IPL71_22680 [Anaerolineales bacterium]|uniref:hypothetical protein n=1 Tax=Candidatus Villigracilis proximus TaxID=3140683 RepID=UPI003135A13E|nr:hypothetical protein [Anaerolineales bacterium]
MMIKKNFTFPASRVGLLAILTFILLTMLPVTSAFAGRLLSLFRVKQLVVLPIESAGYENNTAFGSQLSNLFSSSTIVIKAPADMVVVNNVVEAKEAAGFDVRLPLVFPSTYISVYDSGSYLMKVDRRKVQGFLDEFNHSDLVLPENVDGAEISFRISTAVRAAYGTCPDPMVNIPNSAAYTNCIIFSQTPSPVVEVPDDLDMEKLAQIGLEFFGLSPEEAEAFNSSVDWTTTLVIPIPLNSANYTDVVVDDVIGKLIRREDSDPQKYVLLWVKGDVIYFIAGTGTDISRAVEIAESLP